MQFRLLGPVEVTCASGPLAIGGPKQRSVLAMLALSANRVVPADRLIAGVWGDEAPERAGATLQVYVSNLRRMLRTSDTMLDIPSATIHGRRPGYVLEVEPADVDVLEFTKLVDEGRSALTQDRLAEGADRLRSALALWRGGALADLADEPFGGTEVVRLEQARMGALEERIEADLALGRHRGVVDELDLLVTEHPLRERLWGQLIVALYRVGRQADALAAYGRARTLLQEELGIDPGPALRELEGAILRQELALDVPGARTTSLTAPVRLPTPVGNTIGRDDEVATLREQLTGSTTRMLTLTGPGGSGKTRLLISLAEVAAGDHPGGVYFVDLTAVTEAAQVLPAIAGTLVGTSTRSPHDAAVEALVDRDVLLVLDNFEHVLKAAPDVAALLRAAARLSVLVSSQTPLRIAGEVEHRVRGLAVPPPGAQLAETGASPAVQLFVARAKGSRAGFTLDGGNADLVAEICRRLDGLPLAIELAAARLRMLSVEAVHARLDESLTLLTSGNRDAPTRQRTLRAAIEWSVDLLDEPARDVLGQLGAFAGEFNLAAALAVCGADGEAVLEVLIESSLLQLDGGAGEPRLRVLEAVRQYAREVLITVDHLGAAHVRLVKHYRSAAEAACALVDGPRAAEAVSLVDRQQANFRVAQEHALKSGDLESAARLAVALAPLWLVLGRAGEARQALAAVLAGGGCPAHDAAVNLAAGRLAYQQNDLPAARHLLAAALSQASPAVPLPPGDAALGHSLLAAVATSFGDADAEAAAEAALAAAEADGDYVARVVGRSILAIAAARRGDFDRERELYEQRLLLARRHDDRVRVADTLTVLGEIAFDEKDYPTATQLVREAFALVDGHSRPESRDALIMLGRIAVAVNDPERAVGLLDEALHRSIDAGQPAALALCLRAHAALATVQGDAVRGARLFGAGDSLQPALVPVNAGVERDLADRRAECRAVLGDVAFNRECRQGAELDSLRSVALAARPAAPRLAV